MATAKNIIHGLVPPILWRTGQRLAESAGRRRDRVEDHQTEWLSRSIPGWLPAGNLSLLDDCVAAMPNGAVVEIGSYAGLSLATISHLLARHGRPNPLFSADPWDFEAFREGWAAQSTDLGEPDDATRRKYIIEMFGLAIRTNCAGRLPHHFALSSDAFFEGWSAGATLPGFFGETVTLGGPIALAYIDGDHSYEQSRRDFENVDRHLARGGLIIFDDSADDNKRWGCTRTAQEAAALPTYRLVDKRPNYCIQKL